MYSIMNTSYKDNMSQIIWYGAGKNLRDCEKQFLEETGYPVCICDEAKEKQGTEHTFEDGMKFKIVSLETVKEKYPEYELWITLASHNLPNIYHYLTENRGIALERIKFFGEMEYRLGCLNLIRFL